MSDYEVIKGFLSSSELNRCRKNNLELWVARETWYQVLDYPWLTKKLKRKIGHMIQLSVLPVIRTPLIGVSCDSDLWKELGTALTTKYLEAEDNAIMKGL